MIMRIILLGIVLGFGTVIGVNAIQAVNKMQDAKLSRFCKSIPRGASYDDICSPYWTDKQR